MKVKELIEKLNQINPDAEVTIITDHEYGITETFESEPLILTNADSICILEGKTLDIVKNTTARNYTEGLITL